MKNTIIVVMGLLLMTSFSYGQESDVLEKLSTISDQYGNNFQRPEVDDKLTLIFIEGTNTVLPEIYAKFKGKQLVKNVLVIGGWKDVMPGMPSESKLKHMAEGFRSREGLGNDSYPILFDLNSEIFRMLKLKKYSVVTVFQNEQKVDIKDFGSDRIEFLKAIRGYFN